MKIWYFFYFRSDQDLDPDPFFHETDPRIRIKIKRIRNTDFNQDRLPPTRPQNSLQKFLVSSAKCLMTLSFTSDQPS